MKTNKLKLITLFLDLLIIVVAAGYISLMAGFWNGYPTGTHALEQLAILKYIQQNWPHFDWNYLAEAGQTLTGVMPYLALSVVYFFFPTYFLTYQIAATIATIVILFSTYLLVRELTGNRLAAKIVPLTIISLPAFWSILANGELTTLISVSFLTLAWWLLIKIIDHKNHELKWLAVTILILSGALAGQVLVAILAAVSTLIVIHFSSKDFSDSTDKFTKIFIPALILSLVFLVPNLLNTKFQFFANFSGDFNLNTVANWVVVVLSAALLFQAVSRKEKMYQIPANWHGLKLFFYLSVTIVLLALFNLIAVATALFYLSLTLPLIIGLAYHHRYHRKKGEYIVFSIILISIAFIANLNFPWQSPDIKEISDYRHYDTEHKLQDFELTEFFKSTDAETSRLATQNPHLSKWIGYDYQSPLVTQREFLLTDNNQREFNLDWYAIKYLTEGAEGLELAFTNSEGDISTPFEIYQNPAARPIIEATNAKTMLVIGNREVYDNVWQILSKADLDSRSLIPFPGETYIDLYTAAELAQFDVILLNNFDYFDKGQAFGLLDGYVNGGGSLIIETSSAFTRLNGTVTFNPMPTKQVEFDEFGLEWDLTSTDHPLVADIDLGRFSPPVYGDDNPWGMLYTDFENLKPNSEIVITNHDEVVMATLKRGDGQVIWSGLNLLYHYNNYLNEEELKLIKNILSSAANLDGYEFQNQPGLITNAQDRQLSLANPSFYQGILLKENYHTNWQVKLFGSQTQSKIYRVGPDMMYVFLPATSDPVTVRISYDNLWVEYLALAISVLYLIYLISDMFFKQLFKHILIVGSDEEPTIKLKKTKGTKRSAKKLKFKINKITTN